MAMAKKKAAVKKSDWANNMTKGQKSAAKKAFSRKMSYDRGEPNSVLADDARRRSLSAKSPQGMSKVGAKLVADSKKMAARAAANPSNVKAARSSGYKKAAAVQAYSAAAGRSSKRKRGE